jgi:hypothetical protein
MRLQQLTGSMLCIIAIMNAGILMFSVTDMHVCVRVCVCVIRYAPHVDRNLSLPRVPANITGFTAYKNRQGLFARGGDVWISDSRSVDSTACIQINPRVCLLFGCPAVAVCIKSSAPWFALRGYSSRCGPRNCCHRRGFSPLVFLLASEIKILDACFYTKPRHELTKQETAIVETAMKTVRQLASKKK